MYLMRIIIDEIINTEDIDTYLGWFSSIIIITNDFAIIFFMYI